MIPFIISLPHISFYPNGRESLTEASPGASFPVVVGRGGGVAEELHQPVLVRGGAGTTAETTGGSRVYEESGVRQYSPTCSTSDFNFDRYIYVIYAHVEFNRRKDINNKKVAILLCMIKITEFIMEYVNNVDIPGDGDGSWGFLSDRLPRPFLMSSSRESIRDSLSDTGVLHTLPPGRQHQPWTPSTVRACACTSDVQTQP